MSVADKSNINTVGSVTGSNLYASNAISAGGNIIGSATISAEHFYSTDDIEAVGEVKAEHLRSTDDAQIDDDLNVGGSVDITGTVQAEHVRSSDDAEINASITIGRDIKQNNAALGQVYLNFANMATADPNRVGQLWRKELSPNQWILLISSGD